MESGRFMTQTVPHPSPPARAAVTQPFRKALGELFLLATRLRGYKVSGFPILAYHSVADDPGPDVETVAPADFGRQMAWLAARGFEVVTVSEVVQAMARPSANGRVVGVTFDDGYRDNLLIAFPILQRYRFLASFYISTAYIGGLSVWNPSDYIGHRPMLAAAEVRVLSDAGHEIGSHAHHHIDLTSVDGALVDEELSQSQRILAGVTGKPVFAFAPPHSRSNEAVVQRAARLGYTHMVRGGRFTANPAGTSPFDLRRITIQRGDSLREFARKVSGAYQLLAFRDR